MEVCKNKKSGTFFICVDGDDPARRLLVTPKAQVKSLQASFFDEPIEVAEIDLRDKGIVTQKQLEVYRNYEKLREQRKRLDEVFNELGIPVSGMSSSQREGLVDDLKRAVRRVLP